MSTQQENVPTQELSKKDSEMVEFLGERISFLKEFRKKTLYGCGRSIEDIWRDADKEYAPHELGLGSNQTRIETDDELGLRGRIVQIGEKDGWQSNQANPDFYVKLNSAMSILVDMNPEAVFFPSSKKYEKNTELAYGNWKQSWEVSGAKQQVKNFIFNIGKYGTGIGRTYPRIIEMEKSIRTEYYKDSPDRNKYTKKRLVKFNDLCRENLNPWNVWLSEMTRPGDWNSIDDWYFEKDMSWDRFQQEFGEYPNAKYVKKGSNESNDTDNAEPRINPEDTVTVGFYENQVTDTYCVWVPSSKVLLYTSPLPNDDGMLSLWYAPWTLRDDRCPWGIGIYEIIRGSSIIKDRLMNMTIDQLTISIYKMFFYKGTDLLGDNGVILLSPGEGKQVSDPASVKWLDIPGPGQESWQGLKFIQDRMDLESGVTQQLTGQFGGQTLGQDMQAKEAALERMKTPLDFIIDALQQEAYIAISWQKQLLSTPEILEYTSPEQLSEALKEVGLDDNQIQAYLEEVSNPSGKSDLFFQEEQEEVDEFGQKKNKVFANVFPEATYSLEQDDKGELIESEEKRFYRFGVDIPLQRLDWKGIIRIKPRSVLAPSKELEKRMKLDMFNLVYPAINSMLAQPQFIPMLLPAIKQIIKAYDEDLKNWIDEKSLMTLNQQAMQPKGESPEAKISLSVKFETLTPDLQAQVAEKYLGIKVEKPLFVPNQMIQKTTEIEAEKPLFVPSTSNGDIPKIKPLAQLGETPLTLGGAVSGATEVE